MVAAAYGSTADSSKPVEKEPLAWEDRGTVLSLVIAIAASSASHIVALVLMFLCMKGHEGQLIKCRVGEEGLTPFTVGICEYTKAYAECFPEVCLAVLLLFIARNLLQSRLYYNLLTIRSVIMFSARNMLQDRLVQFLLWCYVHVLGHLGLILYMAFDEHGAEFVTKQAQQSISTGSTAGMKDDYEWTQLVSIATALVVPSTFFLIFLHGSYDIERSLVPLSEYFHDAADCASVERPNSHKEDVTCTLLALDDISTASFLRDKHNEIAPNEEAKNTESLETHLVRRFRADGIKMDGLPPIGLPGALWPARLLGSRKNVGSSAITFRLLWIGYAITAFLACLYLASVHMQILQADFKHWWSTPSHYAIALHMAVVEVHAVALFYVALVFYGSLVNCL